MIRIDREELKNYKDLVYDEEKVIVSSRIISSAGYEPFEIWTYIGKYITPGLAQKCEITEMTSHFRTRRRCILDHVKMPTEPEDYKLFAFSKDSAIMAHVDTNPADQYLRFYHTQTGTQIFDFWLNLIGRVILDDPRSFLKFSNSGNKAALMMYGTDGANVLRIFSIFEQEYVDFLNTPMEDMDVIKVAWTPGDTGLMLVNRDKENNVDELIFYTFEDDTYTTIFDFDRQIEHLEFSPAGDVLIVFLASSREGTTAFPSSFMTLLWPSGTTESWADMRLNEFVDVPERAWSKDGKFLVFNTRNAGVPLLQVYDVENRKLLRMNRSELMLGYCYDFYDDELIVNLITRKALYMAKLPSIEMMEEAQHASLRFITEISDPMNDYSGDMNFYKGPRGDFMYGFLRWPKEMDEYDEKIPLIVIPHSGIGQCPQYTFFDLAIQMLLKSRFAVFQAYYRFNTPPGFGTCRSLPDELDRKDSNDLMEAVNVMLAAENADDIDRENIFLLGHKYGSFVGARALAENQSTFRAAALVDPILHFSCSCGKHTPEQLARAQDHEPYRLHNKIKSPVLLINNQDSECKRDLAALVKKLKRNKVPRRLLKMSLKEEDWVIDCLEWFASHMKTE